MVADPLEALAVALGSEDIEADLDPVGETVGDLDGLVLGMVSGIEAVDEGFAAVDGEIAVQLDHGVMRLHEIVAVDLNFVVVLRVGGQNGREQQSADWQAPKQEFSVHHGVLGISRKMRLTRFPRRRQVDRGHANFPQISAEPSRAMHCLRLLHVLEP